MNAVKRCQALIAATLLIGLVACGGDPTATDAGKGLSIRATPGAVWVRNNSAATVNIEAVDKLGGPVEGSWAVGTITGPFTAVIDTTFQNTSVGQLGVKARFVVTPTAEGEGSVVFSGTGGSITVPIRVAPDTNAFNVVFSTLAPALATTFTATAPAGTRFTAGTTIAFYSGPLTLNLNNGLALPTIVSYNADTTVMTILPAPGAVGQIRFTGVANVSTPGLTTTARSAQTVTVPALVLPATYSANPAAVNTPITFTLPVGFKLRPTSTVSTNGGPFASGATLLPAILVSRSADSTQITVIPMPGFDTLLTVSDVRWVSLPTLNLGLPTSVKVKTTLGAATQSIPDLGPDDASVGAVGNVTITLAVGQTGGFWDKGTWGGSDWVGFGGPEQDVGVTFANAGNYTITFDWDGVAGNASDIDFVIFNSTLTGVIGGFGAATGAHPEALTVNFSAGQQVFFTQGIFAGSPPKTLKYTIKRNS